MYKSECYKNVSVVMHTSCDVVTIGVEKMFIAHIMFFFGQKESYAK